MKKIIIVLVISLSAMNCGYNAIQSLDEGVNASWSEVLNQYQRRADLIPNLVNVVKGYAAHEKEVLENVTNARSKVGGIAATPELVNDEIAFQKFMKAQSEVGSALSRLLAISENYPDLKANENFRDLQAQIEGTENRITVARNRYIKAIQSYNTQIRTFPTVLTARMFGYKSKPNFSVENETELAKPPKVEF